MSDITFSCPSCSQHIACDETYRGDEVQCPTCGALARVPAVPNPVEQPEAADRPKSTPTRTPSEKLAAATKWLLASSIILGLAGFVISSAAFRDIFTGERNPNADRVFEGDPDRRGHWTEWKTTPTADDHANSAAFAVATFLAIAAVTLGHLANRSSRKLPESYVGARPIRAPLVLGYLSTVFWPLYALAIFPHSLSKAESAACVSQLQQLWTGAKYWADDNNGALPPTFISMSNEIALPKILRCPSDTSRQDARTVQQLSDRNTTYVIVSASAHAGDQGPFVRCPIHGLILNANGTIVKNRSDGVNPMRTPSVEVRKKQTDQASGQAQSSMPPKGPEGSKQVVATEFEASQLVQQLRHGGVFWACPEEVTFGVDSGSSPQFGGQTSYRSGSGYFLWPAGETVNHGTNGMQLFGLNWHTGHGQDAHRKSRTTVQGRMLWIRKFASGATQPAIEMWGEQFEEGAQGGTMEIGLPSQAPAGDEVTEISMICFIETEQEGRSNLLELWFKKGREGSDFVTATKSPSWFSSKSPGSDAVGTGRVVSAPEGVPASSDLPKRHEDTVEPTTNKSNSPTFISANHSDASASSQSVARWKGEPVAAAESPIQMKDKWPVCVAPLKLFIPAGSRIKNTLDSRCLCAPFLRLTPGGADEWLYELRPVGQDEIKLPLDNDTPEMLIVSDQVTSAPQTGASFKLQQEFDVRDRKGTIVFTYRRQPSTPRETNPPTSQSISMSTPVASAQTGEAFKSLSWFTTNSLALDIGAFGGVLTAPNGCTLVVVYIRLFAGPAGVHKLTTAEIDRHKNLPPQPTGAWIYEPNGHDFELVAPTGEHIITGSGKFTPSVFEVEPETVEQMVYFVVESERPAGGLALRYKNHSPVDLTEKDRAKTRETGRL